MTTIIKEARKHSIIPGFSGMIKVYDDDMYLWSKVSSVIRVTKEDALRDAVQMEKDAMAGTL
jgi:hypothetical protein